jgi:hypothetical protein
VKISLILTTSVFKSGRDIIFKYTNCVIIYRYLPGNNLKYAMGARSEKQLSGLADDDVALNMIQVRHVVYPAAKEASQTLIGRSIETSISYRQALIWVKLAVSVCVPLKSGVMTQGV